METAVQEREIIEDIRVKEPKKFQTKKIERPRPKFLFIFFKRLFDIFTSLLATIIFALPMLIIAIIIKCTSKGPIIYKQERLGLNGKPFTLYKFRSMIIDAESNGAKWADEGDSRCTKFGRVMRKLHLDELPQLPCNILVGNMTFVGPRPERKCFYEKFAERIEGFEQRLYVKPGLTGLAQINGGYRLKPEEKIVYDLDYIEQQSLLLDTKILLKTCVVVFKRDGAR